jgi:regulation of enolase protein 1 (concanavalin A-like superfamily)
MHWLKRTAAVVGGRRHAADLDRTGHRLLAHDPLRVRARHRCGALTQAPELQVGVMAATPDGAGFDVALHDFTVTPA